MVLWNLPEMLTKVIFGGLSFLESGYIRKSFLVASTAGFGDPSTWNPAPDDPVAIGRGFGDVVALRNVAFIARRQDQKLAALALVGTGVAEIHHVLEPGIVEETQHVGRGLDDHRLISQLQPGGHVDRSSIRSEPQGLGIHQFFKQYRRWYWRARSSRMPFSNACMEAIGMQFRKASVARLRSRLS